jgi:DNA-binding FadR family transcriptional regulator
MDNESLHNRIVREIIARVASGEYPAGRRLPGERALCREFDVARGTLRRALLQLKELGVLAIRPGSGVYVGKLSQTSIPQDVLPPDCRSVDLQDIIDARKAIETAAFRQAARRITAGELRDLRRLVERMEAAVGDLPAFLELDLEFHRAIVRASGNAVLCTAFDAIYQYHRFSAIYTSRRDDDERAALACHRQWLAALEKRDVAAGTRILGRHLEAIAGPNGRPARRKSQTTTRKGQRTTNER